MEERAVGPKSLRGLIPWVQVGLAVALSACTVTSQTPLFKPEEAASPPLAPGRWALHGAGCDVTPYQPLPGCAVPFAVEGDRIIPAKASDAIFPVGSPAASGTGATSVPSVFLLVKGDPQILQFADLTPPATSADTPPPPVTYMAFRPRHQNEAGQTDRGILWPIVCPKDVSATPGLKGLGQACQATTPAAVRDLARTIPPLLSVFMTWTGPAKSDP
jgi:hypothetical protein